VCGLGYLLEEEKVKTTLQSLMRHNFKEELWSHFNHLRSYALGDEAAMLMASYPLGRRPQRPFPYYNEVMTGFEYTAAGHMLYEGMNEEGLKMIRAIRARYNGERRNPFDEAECGHHYARAMASWAAVLALTGFAYSAVTKTLRFSSSQESVQWFWSNGAAWGTVRQEPQTDSIKVELTVLGGSLEVEKLELDGFGGLSLPDAHQVEQNETAQWVVRKSAV
ncbi:MAG: GH116 family glycosyl hydrolase, partial [Abditibacteriaceae bacterium]